MKLLAEVLDIGLGGSQTNCGYSGISPPDAISVLPGFDLPDRLQKRPISALACRRQVWHDGHEILMEEEQIMKRFFSFALALCLVCSSLTVTASAADNGLEEFNAITQSILAMDTDVSQEEIDELLTRLEDLDLDLDQEEDQNELTGSMVGTGSPSIQMMFAQLQLETAQRCKEQAVIYLQEIQAQQELSEQVSGYIEEARRLQKKVQSIESLAEARGEEVQADEAVPVPQDILDFLQSHSLYIPSDADFPDSEEWEEIIWSLEYFRRNIGTSTQEMAEYFQDNMSLYNSYLTSSSAISDSIEALNPLASGGSATMLGAGGAGLVVTALVAGLAIGSLVTALVLRRKRSKA